MESLLEIYQKIKAEIENRIEEFDKVRKYGDNRSFLKELVFCLMTPQSKAKTCAKVADLLFRDDIVFKVSQEELADIIKNVRFRNNKAKYIKEAVKKFDNTDIKKKIESFSSSEEAREWFVKNVKGYGYKEASHFLRNTGFGYGLSILDRHILKNLVEFKVIREMPKSITPGMYRKIEAKMNDFSKDLNIPMHHLDFVLWYKQTKEVFK